MHMTPIELACKSNLYTLTGGDGLGGYGLHRVDRSQTRVIAGPAAHPLVRRYRDVVTNYYYYLLDR